VGTQVGLLKLNPYNGEIIGEVPNLPSGRILALSPNTGNKVWVGTSEGLAWVSMTTGRAAPHGAFVSPVGVRR
ncbi:MAG: transcriptional regulator, partial [Pseudanabaenales cyanobacterium]|nr:transcriptional regulator [Pseudanabaenales cyanobacterium]